MSLSSRGVVSWLKPCFAAALTMSSVGPFVKATWSTTLVNPSWAAICTGDMQITWATFHSLRLTMGTKNHASASEAALLSKALRLWNFMCESFHTTRPHLEAPSTSPPPMACNATLHDNIKDQSRNPGSNTKPCSNRGSNTS